MAVLALALYVVLVAITFGVRVAVQLRRTGSTGLHGLPSGAGATEWVASVLFVAGLATIAVALVLAVAGAIEPIAAIDGPVGHVLGILLAVTGICLTFGAQLAMGDSWRVGVDPGERTELVTSGPFEHVRNPIYSAMLPKFFGLVLMVPNAVAIAGYIILLAGLELQVRRVEEPYLLRVHGEEYANYASRVGRFIPRLGLLHGAGLVALVCGLLCVFVQTPQAHAAEDPAAPMFQPYAIDAINLGLSPESFETLEKEPEENYVDGTFSMAESDGTPGGLGPFSTPIAVGIRLKGGNGSFRELKDKKAAFKIKFNQVKGQKFLGLKKLTLNNMVQDPSMLHETMTYEAFRALGVPAPRTGYANVYVNGVNYGVHLNVETYDDVSLPRLFASTQHLYEADTPGVDVRPDSQKEFELDEGDDEVLSDLEALIAAANGAVGDWSDGMAAVADLDEMAEMWAVERYVGHWDGYAGIAFPADPPFRPNNYYLHSDESGLFSMLPWGTDQTWGTDVEFGGPAGGLLFNECLADESCKAEYVGALRKLEGVVADLDLGTQASCLAERLAPWQAMEDEERREYDDDEIAAGVEGAEEFIASRPEELSDWLATQSPGGEAGTANPAPCGPPEPEPETGSGSSSSSGSTGGSSTTTPPPPPSSSDGGLKLLGFDAGRRQLSARVRTDGPGLLSLTARMPTRKGPHGVCGARLQIDRAGRANLACRLSRSARRRLRSRDLQLRVSVGFTPANGERATIEKTLTIAVPRRPTSDGLLRSHRRRDLSGPLGPPGAFELHGSNGYLVRVWGLLARHGGQGSALVLVRGRGGAVNYFAPATVTRTAIRARLGDLGEIDVDFNPSGRPMRERPVCGGEPVLFDAGSYEGTIDFTGEQGYTEVHATSVKGDLQFALDGVCGGPLRMRTSSLPGAELSIVHHVSGVGASLTAEKNGPRARSAFEASVAEERDGVGIERFVGIWAPSTAFDYDPLLRTAVVEPPPPFSGRATFRRNARPANRWSGHLTVDFPGRSGVSLTVGSPSAKLVHAKWQGGGRSGEEAADAP
jgi:protein-S-isoprenylcysteine O-methyltransferase Ste14